MRPRSRAVVDSAQWCVAQARRGAMLGQPPFLLQSKRAAVSVIRRRACSTATRAASTTRSHTWILGGREADVDVRLDP